MASIRSEASSRPAQTDSVPVVQGIEFPTPQNSACLHLSPPGPNSPVSSEPTHSGFKEPPKFPIFSDIGPSPKDEMSYDQWVFQVRGAMISCRVAVVWSGIVNSAQGEARELVDYIGFDMSLDVIIDKIEECYSKT